ncbi:enhancer of mRNA-decapping protein 1 [Scheffersomyces amazonensis]|uniref:enhancer of mRNA-decapping protein 1 n=1 Tax=Scheffersomyces amazonensis TaxID=1078765 RepID=UPI00315DD04F
MAQVVPIVEVNQTPKGTKHTKNKDVKKLNDNERRLPNGEKVDFGHSKSKKSNKKSSSPEPDSKKKSNKKEIETLASSPSLPNGNKPNFYNDNNEKSKESTRNKKKSSNGYNSESSLPNGEKPNFNTDSSKSKKSDQSLPNGEKPNFGNEKSSSSSKKDKSKKPEDIYAGSSFGTSPAALNLPKPSFKSSPRQSSGNNAQDHSPTSSISTGSSSPLNSNTVPRYPVTTYPTSYPVAPSFPPQQFPPNQYILPGFAYNVSPQGYINYQYPPYPAPIPGAGVAPFHGNDYPRPSPSPYGGNPAVPQHGNSNEGQKITFNDLLSSSK